MKKYTRRTKISKKILHVVASAVLLCTLLCGGAVYLYFKPVTENLLKERNTNMVQKMAREAVNSLESMELYAQNISFDETVQESLKKILACKAGSYQYFASIQNMEKKLKEFQFLRDDLLYDIFVVSPEGEILETTHTYRDLIQELVYQEAFEQEKNVFLPEETVSYYGAYGKKNTIPYVSTIYDKEKVKVHIGTLVLLINADQAASPLLLEQQSVQTSLYTAEGVCIFGGIEDISRRDQNIYEYILGKDQWNLKYKILEDDISSTITQMSLAVLLIIVVVLFVMLGAVIQVAGRVVRPLEELIRGMQQVAAGSRKERIEIRTGDGCEVAADVFNEMVEKLDEHTKQILEGEKRQYASQMKMLSYQLNPHFIYNTLNAVICLARQQNYTEIIRLTRSLIGILQLILRTDLQAMSTVLGEQRFINKYVEVLQVCYHNIPDVEWNIQEECMEKQLPRLILYPLVENSVFHGIIPAEHAGLLRISIESSKGFVKICVEDDGIGCTKEDIENIQERLKEGKTGGHIGLYNVFERLKLIYEEQFSFSIEQRMEGGTRICLQFKDREV